MQNKGGVVVELPEECTVRAMEITVNAMGLRDAVRTILDHAGDIDFSPIKRQAAELEDIQDIEVDDNGVETPGGFVATLLRVAYHGSSGHEVDSSYHIENIDGPRDFHEKPRLGSDHPNLADVIRARSERASLEAGTVHAEKPGEPGAGRGPRI